MKMLIFLSSALVLVNLAIAFNPKGFIDDGFGEPRDEKLQDYLATLQNLLKNERKAAVKLELVEAIEFIELVESIQVPSIDAGRQKRHLGSPSCATLNNELESINNQIAFVQDVTATLETINQKVGAYNIKVGASTSSTQTNQNLSKTYSSLATSASTKIASLKDQLASLQARKAQLESKLSTDCGQTFLPATSQETSSYPCGTFVKYDPVNKINDPVAKGFSAGPSKDGFATYVGQGNNNQNGCSQNPCPGRLTINPAKPGVFMTCSGSETFDSTTSYYLLNHEDLRWVRTDYNNMRNLTTAVQLTSSNGSPFLYGRVKIANYYQVGKVQNGNGQFAAYFMADGSEQAMYYGFDVLVCDCSIPKSPHKNQHECDDPPPCGTFVKYDAKVNYTEPETKGVLGGSFKDGRDSYVGYGNNWGFYCKSFPCPGRISTDPATKGTYLACLGDVLDSENAYYLLNHEHLRWVETDHITMRTLPGAVNITSNERYPFLFGRVKVGDRYTLGKVHNGNGIFRFYFSQDDGSEHGMLYGFEVLVCNSALPKH